MLYIILYIGFVIIFMLGLYFIRGIYTSIGCLAQMLYTLESRVIMLERQMERLNESKKSEIKE